MQALANGIHLFYADSGSGSGAPVVLLHGFPETHRSWDLQVPALRDAGFRAVTPDLRGYGRSEHPPSGYDLDTLAADVVSLVDHLGAGRVSLVGHDWGGAIAWHVATRYPDKLDRVVVLDCPHPALMARALRTNGRQRRRSWYMFFFQLPRAPEHWLAKNRGANISRMFRQRPGPPGIVDAETRALIGPDALRGPLAYYRTMFRDNLGTLLGGNLDGDYTSIDPPVTLIWGESDSCLGTELIDGTERFAPRLAVHRIADAGHFVHQERPDAVNRILIDALRA